MGVVFLGSYLCISILEFKFGQERLLVVWQRHLCISILEFKSSQKKLLKIESFIYVFLY